MDIRSPLVSEEKTKIELGPTTDRVGNPQRIELDIRSPLVSEEKTKIELRPTTDRAGDPQRSSEEIELD